MSGQARRTSSSRSSWPRGIRAGQPHPPPPQRLPQREVDHPPLDDWLTTVFQPHRLDGTIDLMAAAAQPESHPDTAGAEAARALIADCDAKLTTHRAALEAGAGPTVITQWIAETQATHARAEADLRTTAHGTHPRRMTRDEIARLVRSISDLPPARPPAHVRPRPPDHPRRDHPHPARPQQRQIPTVSEKPWGFGPCPRGDRYQCPTDSDDHHGSGSLAVTAARARPHRRVTAWSADRVTGIRGAIGTASLVVRLIEKCHLMSTPLRSAARCRLGSSTVPGDARAALDADGAVGERLIGGLT